MFRASLQRVEGHDGLEVGCQRIAGHTRRPKRICCIHAARITEGCLLMYKVSPTRNTSPHCSGQLTVILRICSSHRCVTWFHLPVEAPGGHIKHVHIHLLPISAKLPAGVQPETDLSEGQIPVPAAFFIITQHEQSRFSAASNDVSVCVDRSDNGGCKEHV